MSATGGMSAGGNPNGGGANAGGAGTGGGTGGIPNDPNWMPPDMSNAKIVAFYHVDQGAATSTNIQMTIVLKNQTDAAYDLTNVTVRYWMSSEPPPRPEQYYSSAGLRLTGAPTFVPNMAVSYLLLSFRAGGVVPAYVDQNTLEQSRIQIGVQAGSAGNTRFNQANDWSFDATASGSKANPKITVYDGDTLIWGCEPSHVCAVISDGGEGGAGGQGS